MQIVQDNIKASSRIKLIADGTYNLTGYGVINTFMVKFAPSSSSTFTLFCLDNNVEIGSISKLIDNYKPRFRLAYKNELKFS